MNNFLALWLWLTSHGQDLLNILTGGKTITDIAVNVQKLAPQTLEVKESTQTYMEGTVAIMEDQNKPFEERRFEVDARNEMVQNMVHLTMIEAAYNIARLTIVTAFTGFTYYVLMKKVLTRREKN